MAEKRTRRHTFSIEDAIENSLAQPHELDLGLALYSPKGKVIVAAEEVDEDSVKDVNDSEEEYEEEFFDEDSEESEEEEFFDDEPEESEEEFFDEDPEEFVNQEEETQEFHRSEARRIYRRPVRTSDVNEETTAKSENTSVVSKAKDFFKQSVLPLFVETKEVTDENDEFEDVIDDVEYEEEVEASDGVNEGFLSRAANFFNSKVVNPIKEKFADDEEEYFEEEQETACEDRRESLRVIDNRRTTPIDAEYSHIEDDEEFFDEEVEEEPGFFRRILDHFVNPDDDFEDEVDYEDDEEDPDLIDSVRGFFANRKKQNVEDDEVVYEESVTDTKKSTTKFSDRLMKLFYDDTVDVEDEESFETVEETDSEEEEDYSSYSVPDPKIYAEIMREKEAEREAINKK